MFIYLIRHAETDSNRDKIVQTPDTPLSKLGLEQAEQLAQAYRHSDISLVLCSDHTRTRQTAAPLVATLNCEYIETEQLRERNFGLLRGKKYADIKEDFFAQDYFPPKGESHQQFVDRVSNAWQSIMHIAHRKQQSVAVITHGLVLRSLLVNQLKVDQIQLLNSQIANTCVTKIALDQDNAIQQLCNSEHLTNKSIDGAKV